MDERLAKVAESPEAKRVMRALKQAREGDPTELNRLYDKYPEAWRHLGDLSRDIEKSILAWWKGTLGDAPDRWLSEMRQSLGYDSASELQRLLIDRVVVCWLRVQQAENVKTGRDKEGHSRQWATVWERRLQLAHRNFLSACKTLAQVGKLLKPVVAQVNIGQQQVNVAQVEAGSIEREQ